MEYRAISIRPFIGAKDYEISRTFYRDLGFQESILTNGMSLFTIEQLGFYLQNAYVKEWVDNTMVFLEVEDVESYRNRLAALNLTNKFQNVKLSLIRQEPWGKECFLYDPSGILWHIGEFAQLK